MEVGKSFDSFDSFKSYFKDYQKETNQVFVIHKSKSIEAVNKKLDARSVKYNEPLRWAYLWYQCKNGGKPRFAGDGVSRPNQRYVIEA